MEMTFNNIHQDTTCDCLKNAIIDNDTTFGIKTNKAKIREKDFISKWERGEKPTSDCRKICSKKGISVSKFDDTNKGEVLKIFKEVFHISPCYKPYLNVIKFYEDSGMVKRASSYNNPYHCNFYKCDTFDYRKILPVETIQLV